MKQEHQTASVAPAPAANRERGTESITDLIRHLATDLSSLLGKEVELAKYEVRESVSDVQTALGAIATGTAIATAGLVVLLMSAVYGLSKVVDPWLAALIVGVAALLVGYTMIQSAKKSLGANTIVPERTMESARKDKATIERATQ